MHAAPHDICLPGGRRLAFPYGAVAALGNFDGVHCGHQALLKAALAKANAIGGRAAAVTFEPHPVSLLRPGTPAFRLTSPKEKRERLEALGVDVVCVPFTADFAAMSPHDFVERILMQARVKALTVGEGFRFGAGRKGDVALLKQYANQGAFDFWTASLLHRASGERFSSGGARQALAAGQMDDVEAFLGRPWILSGPVIHGDARARLLGYPTANVKLPADLMPPRFGVYLSETTIGKKTKRRSYRSLTNIGVRPTFYDDSKRHDVLIETYLLPPYTGDTLYGQTIHVRPIRFVRPERRFASVAELTEAIREDVRIATEDANATQRGALDSER